MSVDAPATEEVERTRRVYHWIAPVYDLLRSLWSRWTRPAEEELDQLFRERIGPGTRILELAPGTGINIERLLRRAPDFRSYLGIDSSPEMLEKARTRAGGDSRIRLVIGDATDLARVDGDFELVVSTWLLSHLDSPAETVRAAVAKLAPGGTAAFVFFGPARSRFLRWILGVLSGPGCYRSIDSATIGELPLLERLSSYAGGSATVAVFHRGPVSASV